MSVSEPVDLIATSESKPKPKPKPTPKKNPNALMMLFRKYHTWFGLFAAGFVVMIALTGIYLNHKNTFQLLLPEGKTTTEHIGPSGKMGIPTGEEIAALPMSMQQALEQATPHLQDRPIEKIELRSEHGKLVYKVKSIEGPEAVIDVYTRELEIKGDKKNVKPEGTKGENSKPKKEKPEPKEEIQIAQVTAVETKPKGTDWGKAIKDLHTGKIGGDAGKLLIDAVAVLLIVLTVSGIYLWIVPVLRKRRAAKRNAAKVIPASGTV